VHARAPQRTSLSGSRCSAWVRRGVPAGRAGVGGVWLLRSLSRGWLEALALLPGGSASNARRSESARSPSHGGASAGGGCGSRVAAAGRHRVFVAVARGDQHGGEDRSGDGEAGADEERLVKAFG
jgi:hypothetical protein